MKIETALTNADERAILEIEQAMAGKFTADDIIQHVAPGIVLDDTVPGRIRGREAVRAYLAAGIASLAEVSLEILDIAIRANDQLGFAHSRQHIVWKGKNGMPDMDMIFRQTCCYEKIDGHWLVSYQHVSVPVDLLQSQRGVFHDCQ